MQSIPVDQMCSSIYGESAVKSSNTGKSDSTATHDLGCSCGLLHSDSIGSLCTPETSTLVTSSQKDLSTIQTIYGEHKEKHLQSDCCLYMHFK